MSAPEDALDGRRQRALEECADLTARSRSNFHLAFLPLPRRRREGIFCVYAFCRRIDDLVDEPQEGIDPAEELTIWRRRVRQLCSHELPADEDPLALGLSLAHDRFGLEERDLLAVIDGMEMDLVQDRYETREELALYCRRVAGHVGCLCLPVFGSVAASGRDYAMRLGEAFQLTNILRDVNQDASEGRIYLPLEDLERHGVSEEEVLEGRRSAGLRALLREHGRRAAELYLEAESRLPAGERSLLYSASIMAAIYRRVLEDLQASDYDPATRRPPRRVKLLLALGVLARDRLLYLT